MEKRQAKAPFVGLLDCKYRDWVLVDETDNRKYIFLQSSRLQIELLPLMLIYQHVIFKQWLYIHYNKGYWVIELFNVLIKVSAKRLPNKINRIRNVSVTKKQKTMIFLYKKIVCLLFF